MRGDRQSGARLQSDSRGVLPAPSDPPSRRAEALEILAGAMAKILLAGSPAPATGNTEQLLANSSKDTPDA